VSIWSKIKRVWITHVAKPVGEVWIHKAILEKPVTKLMELGVDSGQRSLKLLQLIKEHQASQVLHYYAVDLFEGREDAGQEPGLSYKEAHKLLKSTGARIQLIPGTPLMALMRTANTIRDLDLLIINADQLGPELDQAWLYIPRMLAPHARIIVEEPSTPAGYRYLTAAEIQQHSAAVQQRRRAA
jgi:hypothetical protein